MTSPEDAVCFVAGTLVLMADGSAKAIEDIEPGEMVLAVPEDDPEARVTTARVSETYRKKPHPLLAVQAAGQTIRCTFNHPFYVAEQGWAKARDLKPGDRLRSPDGTWIAVQSASATDTAEPVFNLNVSELHTYFVRFPNADAVLVHNDACGDVNLNDLPIVVVTSGTSAYGTTQTSVFIINGKAYNVQQVKVRNYPVQPSKLFSEGISGYAQNNDDMLNLDQQMKAWSQRNGINLTAPKLFSSTNDADMYAIPGSPAAPDIAQAALAGEAPSGPLQYVPIVGNVRSLLHDLAAGNDSGAVAAVLGVGVDAFFTATGAIELRAGVAAFFAGATERGLVDEAVAQLAQKLENVIDDTAGSESVWQLSDTDRGIAIEKQLAATEYKDWFHVGAEDGGTFPLVDFQKGQTLVSLKTVNTTGTSWLRTMQNHIEELGTRGATVSGKPAVMILDLRVQPGGAAAAQSLIAYGQKYGVQVIITEYP